MSKAKRSKSVDVAPQPEESIRAILLENKWAFLRNVMFLLYLCVLIIVVNNTRPSFLANQYATHLRERFMLREYGILDNSGTPLYALVDEVQIWNYVVQFMLPGIFENNLPSGALKGTVNEQSTIMNNMRRVGAVRVRQIRVKAGSCGVVDRFEPIVDQCAAPYTKDDQSKESYGPGGRFVYANQPGEQLFFIERRSYPGGGFSVVLNSSVLADNVAAVNSLITDRFVDAQTRLLDFRFAFYNPYLDSIAVCTIAFEFLVSGGIRPFASFRLVSLSGFPDGRDSAYKIVFEALLYVFVLIMIASQIYYLIKKGWAYFKNGWNWVNLILIALFVALFIYRMISVVELAEFEFEPTNSSYVDFSKVELLRVLERRTLAFAIWLSLFKLFQLLSSNAKLSQLLSTLEEAAPDICLFIVIILIVLFGFVFAAQLLFGEVVREVSQFSTALSWVVRMGLGNSVYDELVLADFSAGPLYFYVLTFILAMFLINTFVAVILAAHESILQEEEEKRWAGSDPTPFASAASIVINRLRRMLGLREKRLVVEAERQQTLKEADLDENGLLDANELSAIIKSHPGKAPTLLGVTEVAAIYDRYDASNERAFTAAEQRAFFSVLDERRQNIVLLEEIIALEKALGVAPPDTIRAVADAASRVSDDSSGAVSTSADTDFTYTYASGDDQSTGDDDDDDSDDDDSDDE